MKERTISTITLQVAIAIGGAEAFNQIERFTKEAQANEYTAFTHYSFFYSYPVWGKKWSNGKCSEFHRVQTKCHHCDQTPERNFAGVGTIYLLNTGKRMTILCQDHIESYRKWHKSQEQRKGKQLHFDF